MGKAFLCGREFRGSLGNSLRVENFRIAKLFAECVASAKG